MTCEKQSFHGLRSPFHIDCKTVGFFLKISKEIGKGWRKSLTGASIVSPQSRSLFSASFQTFCLTVRTYLNTQKYGLFCSLLSICLLFSLQKNLRLAVTLETEKNGPSIRDSMFSFMQLPIFFHNLFHFSLYKMLHLLSRST